MSKKVLVTGGTGYIGSHTVVELISSGYEPVIVDDLSNSKIDALDGIEKITGVKPKFYKIDLTDKKASKVIFDENRIDAIIHFAASKAVGESVAIPLHYYKNNLYSLVNLLELMKEYEVGSIVFSSSCTVYGQPDKLPVTEDSPVVPAASPYGNTKQICEEILVDTLKVEPSLKAISLRYFNPVGAHESGLLGELPQGVPNNLLPYLLKVVAGELDQLSVFGGDYDTPDGTCIRDYIHVVDLSKAHVVALERLNQGENKANYEVFNLGTGEGYSVLDVIKAFEKATGQSVNYKIAPRRPGDVVEIYADTTYANDELGWKTALGLDDMMTSAWKWQKHLVNG